MDDFIERRRMERSSLKLDVLQKVPELVVNRPMSQGEQEKDTKEKKKVPGWSIEEMKERRNIAVEEDREEMKRWRSRYQSEMDLCWKNLAERMEEEVLDKYKVEESKNNGPSKVEVTPWNGEEYVEVKNTDCWAIIFYCFREYHLQRLQSKQEESTVKEEMKQQERKAKKIGSKGSIDAQNRWWVAELLSKDCEKGWTHTGWEDTMQKWYEWLKHMKKKDEKEKMEEMHQRKVEKMIKSAEWSAGLLHTITKPTMWRGGVQILKEEEDARLLD